MILSSMIAVAMAGMAMPAETCVPAPVAGHAGAKALPWYINGEKVVLDGRTFGKFGLPRVLRKGDVTAHKPYKGGHFFVESGAVQVEVLYLLTDLNACEFQPYMLEPK